MTIAGTMWLYRETAVIDSVTTGRLAAAPAGGLVSVRRLERGTGSAPLPLLATAVPPAMRALAIGAEPARRSLLGTTTDDRGRAARSSSPGRST